MGDIIIDTIVLALISSLFIAAGLRLLLAKRPFIVDSQWWRLLCIAPLMLSSIKLLLSEYMWQSRLCAFFAYVTIGGMAILLGLILWAPGGGIIIGVTATTLRDALRQAFSRLGLSYEESAKAFRLPTLNNELFTQAPLIDGVFFSSSKGSGVFAQCDNWRDNWRRRSMSSSEPRQYESTNVLAMRSL
jgi:hypothetical protein